MTVCAPLDMRLNTSLLTGAQLSLAVSREATFDVKTEFHLMKTPHQSHSLAGRRYDAVHAQVFHHLPVVVRGMSYGARHEPDASLRAFTEGVLDRFEHI